jgi:glycosyltransferase involved in cell wall biosynthesis
MNKKKVMYVVHGHPALVPGGSEGYALEVYEAMKRSKGFEPIMLARNGPPHAVTYDRDRTGSALVSDDPNQLLFLTDASDYEWFLGSPAKKFPLTKYFAEVLTSQNPDVVHFQHTLFLGYQAIRTTRRVLPDAAIVYTLHEYLPICHRFGQMIRTKDDELCEEESPRRCHECYPSIRPHEFHLRKRFVQASFDEVDLFLSPSMFLRQRYIEWGLPAEKIVHENNGRRPNQPLPETDRRERTRLAFFGNLSHFKGLNVLLKAMAILDETAPDVRLWLHGANLDVQDKKFRTEFGELLDQAGENVTMVGRYRPQELARLMSEIDWVVIPSIWWENSPLVIQEAFGHGRPVICSNVGGMAEKVIAGVNGLHFRVGDHVSLAQTIERAVADSQTWETLRAGIPEVYRVDEHVERLEEIYSQVLRTRTPEDRAEASAQMRRPSSEPIGTG